MNSNGPITLTRDVECTAIPAGTKVMVQKAEQAFIMQSLGGSYTVTVNGNLFRIEAKDADALGIQVAAESTAKTATSRSAESVTMHSNEPITLTRDVEGHIVPAGTKVTLDKGEQAVITQSLGGNYTVVVNGNMFRLEAKDADALGLEVAAKSTADTGTPGTVEELEQEAWNKMRTCYDPEIPVNIVDLGLIYDCHFEPLGAPDRYKAHVKMTLTAPGCGMGGVISEEVKNKLLSIEGIDDANVEVGFEPQWNQGMMSEAARLQLGLM
jgi:probable FeS assembly SUF system protein SufT